VISNCSGLTINLPPSFVDCSTDDKIDLCTKMFKMEQGYVMHSDLILERSTLSTNRVFGMMKLIAQDMFKIFTID
jgi:hypothetical protein